MTTNLELTATIRRNRFEQAMREFGVGVELEPHGIAVTYRGETLRVPLAVWHDVRETFEAIPLAETDAQAGAHYWRTLTAAEQVWDAWMMAADVRARRRTALAEKRRFAADLAFCIALADQRKWENAARRAACMADLSLCAILLEDAQREGRPEINWKEYFTLAGLS